MRSSGSTSSLGRLPCRSSGHFTRVFRRCSRTKKAKRLTQKTPSPPWYLPVGALSGNPENAAWSAERAYNTLDTYVQNTEDIDPNASGGEDAILRHPLI